MSLHKNVSDYIMQKINAGEWKKGDQIPREIDLCRQFSVSRSTVRAALMNLVNQGYLTRVKGKGTYISKPKMLEQTTIFIESFAQELLSRGLTVKTELLEFCLVPATPQLAQRMNIKPEEKLLKITRLRYADKAFDTGPVVLTTSYFPASFASFVQEYNLEKTAMFQVLKENGLERKVFEKEISVKILSEKECRLLGESKDALAVCISSMAWDQHERELEYSESNYPVDKNKFIFRIRT